MTGELGCAEVAFDPVEHVGGPVRVGGEYFDFGERADVGDGVDGNGDVAVFGGVYSMWCLLTWARWTMLSIVNS